MAKVIMAMVKACGHFVSASLEHGQAMSMPLNPGIGGGPGAEDPI